MFIDIGASSQEEAMEWGVRPGDQVVPYFEFQVMKNEKCYLQKHGITESVCAITIDVLKQLKDEKHQTLYMALELYKKKLVFVAQKHLRIILNQIYVRSRCYRWRYTGCNVKEAQK